MIPGNVVNPALCHSLCLVVVACGGGGGSGEDAGGDTLEDTFDVADDVAVDDAVEEEPFDEDGYTWPGFVPDAGRIYDDIEYLASDDLEGRDTGEEGNELALDYIEARFSELGLLPVGDDGTYRQAFTYDRWTLDAPLSLVIDGTELVAGEQFDVMRYSGSGNVTGPLIYVGHGMVMEPYDPAEYPDCHITSEGYDDYAGLDVEGAIVLTTGGVPGTMDPYHPPDCPYIGVMESAAARNVGALIRLPAIGMPSVVMHGATASIVPMLTDVPLLQGEGELFSTMIPEMDSWVREIEENLAPSSHDTGLVASVFVETSLNTIVAQNVLGAIEGVDPTLAGEVVVIGGHMDHEWVDPGTGAIFNGADDNASGTSMVMELARGVALGVVHPRRTMVFAAWNAEEQGLLGSCAYVDDPSYPIDSMFATINIDAVGAGSPGLVLPGGGEENNRWMYDFLMDAFLDSGLSGVIRLSPEYSYSDHACFDLHDVPYVFMMSAGSHCCAHTATDTIENIDIEILDFVARMSWSLTEALATGTEDSYLD